MAMVGYVILRLKSGAGKEYLTTEGDWTFDASKARIFAPNDWCDGPEDRNTKRFGRHRADVEADLRTVPGKARPYVAVRTETPEPEPAREPPKRRNRFLDGEPDDTPTPYKDD